MCAALTDKLQHSPSSTEPPPPLFQRETSSSSQSLVTSQIKAMDGRTEEEGEVLGKPGLAGEGEVTVTFQVGRPVDARRRSVHRRTPGQLPLPRRIKLTNLAHLEVWGN
jgi:hypothetical protein